MLQHKVSEGGITFVGRTWRMYLTIDGQKKFQNSGTDNEELAREKLSEWRTQEKLGVRQDSRLKYEEMRDTYLGEGHPMQDAHRRDLDIFFKGLYISAITVDKMEQFRTWRESTEENLERKAENLAKRIAWGLAKAGNPTGAEKQTIIAAATEWVERGTKATTNRRLTVLRAMFRLLMKKGKINSADLPHFPLWSNVDNIKRGFLEKEDLPKILAEIPERYHGYAWFVYSTGMRSGQAAKLTWDMLDVKLMELHIPGSLIKNREDFVLPLVGVDGKTPLPQFKESCAYIKAAIKKNGGKKPTGLLFNTADFRRHWQLACHKLGYGRLDKEKGTYIGLGLHDFRRSAARNMTKARVPQAAAMAVSGHKTDSIFKRYSIMDKTAVQAALSGAK